MVRRSLRAGGGLCSVSCPVKRSPTPMLRARLRPATRLVARRRRPRRITRRQPPPVRVRVHPRRRRLTPHRIPRPVSIRNRTQPSPLASSKSEHASSRKNSKKRTTARGQQKIDPERAQAIQEALIREHYMSGEPTGTWNQASEDAMRRYQADHGWQSKTVPDSRALISLGLGPSHDHLLNPESAMTTGAGGFSCSSRDSHPENPVSHSAEPGARISTASDAVCRSGAGRTSDHDASGPQ